MNFEPGYLFASLCVGGVGYVLFSYGRKQSRFPHLATGIILLVYPYFVGQVGPMIAIGAALLAVLFAAVRMGF